MHKGIFFIILCIIRITLHIDYRAWDNSVRLPKRMTELIMSYNERGIFQINEITPIRSKYEVSPHFEMGYVMSEVLERYRKMVGHVKRPMEYKMDSFMDVVKSTELIQKLFLEINQLVNMMHEIPKKYSHMKEFQDAGPKFDPEHAKNLISQIEIMEKIREKERKKRMKEYKKQRKLFLKGIIVDKPKKSIRPKNKWWPIDYGWEVELQWFL